jgi:formyltetrahydrofolate-dependent phosphoribosylglycinamide formyltransferase
MFQSLQQKWGVSTRQFWVLFLVFALTGTTTAYFTRYLTAWLGMDAQTFWLWKAFLRIGMLIFGYQFLLLGYGALFGQWAFFWKYERKMLQKLGILQKEGKTEKAKLKTEPQTLSIAIFASGAGSNAEKIIYYLKDHPVIRVALIVCNKPEAGVLTIATAAGIPALLIEKERFFRGDSYLSELSAHQIRFIVLAGFLWKIPDALIKAYPDKIINIHPALLPKYGGKGMYGMRVHEAVIAGNEKESGITIHYVNEHFDEGTPIFQTTCPIEPGDTPDKLAQKIHQLEHTYFPETVVRVLKKTFPEIL